MTGINTLVPTHPRDRSPCLCNYRYGREKEVCYAARRGGCVGTGVLVPVLSVATPNHWREISDFHVGSDCHVRGYNEGSLSSSEIIDKSLTPSLSLSHTHTHTHARIHSLSLSLSLSLTHKSQLALSLPQNSPPTHSGFSLPHSIMRMDLAGRDVTLQLQVTPLPLSPPYYKSRNLVFFCCFIYV